MSQGSREVLSKLWFIKYLVMAIIVVALIVPFFEDVRDNSKFYLLLTLLPLIALIGAVVFYSFHQAIELKAGKRSVRISAAGLDEGDAARILDILREAKSSDDSGAKS